eukprot:6983442-Prorocentrum_lima.AAC.1
MCCARAAHVSPQRLATERGSARSPGAPESAAAALGKALGNGAAQAHMVTGKRCAGVLRPGEGGGRAVASRR